MSVKRIPAREAMVEITITLTEEEYNRLNSKALWDYGSIESYIKAIANGNAVRRGC